MLRQARAKSFIERGDGDGGSGSDSNSSDISNSSSSSSSSNDGEGGGSGDCGEGVRDARERDGSQPLVVCPSARLYITCKRLGY